MRAVGESTGGQDTVIRVLQEVEVNTTVSNSDGNARSSSDSSSRTRIEGSTRNSDGKSLCGTEEAAWIKDRLARKRAAAREAGSRRHQHQQHYLSHDSRGAIAQAIAQDCVEGLGTLQLRRVLRAVGLPTDGLQELLAKRMREAIATGRLAAFVEEQRAIPRESFQCVVYMRRKAAMLALVESLIAAFPGPDISRPAAPARVESDNNDRDEHVTSPSCGPVPEIAQPIREEEQSPLPSNPSSPIATVPRFEAIDSPSTPATLPATPPPRTPETPTITTGATFSKIAQEPPASGSVGQPSSSPPEEPHNVSASSTVTSCAALEGDASVVDGAQQVDATARMKDGRGRPRTKQVMWGLPFAKKSTDKAPISGPAATVEGGKEGLLMDKVPRPKTTTTTSRWRRVVGGRSWVRRGPTTCTADGDADDTDTDTDAADVAPTTPVTCSAVLETASTSASKNRSTTTTAVTSALGISSLLRPSRFVSRSPSPQRKKPTGTLAPNGTLSPDESSPSKIRSRSPSPSRKARSPLTTANAAATETAAAIKTAAPEQTVSSSTVGATSQRHKDATVPTPAAADDVASHSSDPDAKRSVMSSPTITAGAPPNQGAITKESSSGQAGAAEGALNGGIGNSSINAIVITPDSTPSRDATPVKPPQPVTTPAVKLLPPGARWGSRTVALSTGIETTNVAAVAEKESKKPPPRRVEPNLAPSPTGGEVSLGETTCVSAKRNGHHESQGAEPVRAMVGEQGIVGTHPADAQSQSARDNLEKKIAAMTTTSTTSTKPPRTPATAVTPESTTSPSAKAPSIAVSPHSSSATPGASSRAVGPPPVPPRPIAPPVPPRTAVVKMAATVVNVKSTVAAPPRERPSPGSSSTTTAASSTSPTNPLLPPAAVSGGMAVRSQAVIAPPTAAAYVGSNSSSKSVRRPGLASGGVGLQRSGGAGARLRAPLSGGVGVHRSGMIRAVSPSRLPAPIDDDDDSSDYIINITKPVTKDNSKPGGSSHSKVLKPSAAVANSHKIQAHHNKHHNKHHNTHHNKHQQQGAHQHQKPPLEKKPFRSKNIEVIFGDDDGDEEEEEEDDGGDDDSDSEDDHEYSMRPDSDSDDENDPALRILEPSVTPEWAKPEAVTAALERQYGGDKPVNPSTIFVDFYTCSLENIFDTKKKKWDRKSTGDWMTDRLTIAEKMAYDRAMGYVTIGGISNNSNKAGGSSGRNKTSSRADERLRT